MVQHDIIYTLTILARGSIIVAKVRCQKLSSHTSNFLTQNICNQHSEALCSTGRTGDNANDSDPGCLGCLGCLGWRSVAPLTGDQ